MILIPQILFWRKKIKFKIKNKPNNQKVKSKSLSTLFQCLKGSTLTFLWVSIKSLSSSWLSNNLYLIWKEFRDYCKSSGYLLRDFWIPNLEVYLPCWRNISKLEAFPISAERWYGQPFDVISGWVPPLLVVWFSAQALVQTLSECNISLPSSFEKWDSFNGANLFWKLCMACQISKTLITSLRRLRMNLMQVLIQLVILYASELALMTNGDQMQRTICWVNKTHSQPGDRSHCTWETSISPQLLSERNYTRVQFGEQSAGKQSDSPGVTSSLEMHLWANVAPRQLSASIWWEDKISEARRY